MKNLRVPAAFLFIWLLAFNSLTVFAQFEVSVSDIAGSSSVFVFRSARKAPPKRNYAQKPKVQKTASVAVTRRFVKQYVAIAKVAPRKNRAVIVAPSAAPKNLNTLTKEKASNVLAGLGEYYFTNNQNEDAIEAFRDSLRLLPTNQAAKNGLSDAFAIKGNKLLENDDSQSAYAFFVESKKMNEMNAAANFGLGQIQYEKGENDAAIASFEKAVSIDPTLTEVYGPLGVLYYRKGEVDKADTALTKALASDADQAEIQLYFGLLRGLQNRPAESKTALEKAAALDNTNDDIQLALAELAVKQKDLTAAEKYFRNTVALNAKNIDAWFGLGSLLYDARKLDESIVAFKETVKLNNTDARNYVALGNAYRDANKFGDAEGMYNLAVVFMNKSADFSPSDKAEVYSSIGYILGAQCEINLRKSVPCKWDVAIANLQKAIEISPTAADYSNLGWAFYNSARLEMRGQVTDPIRQKLEKAKVALTEAVTRDPKNSAAARLNLGATLIDLGEYPLAVQHLKIVVEERNDWTFARYAYGVALRKTNSYKDAVEQFKAVVNKDPNHVPALSGLAESLIKLGDKKEAQKVIDKIKKLNPNEAQKLEILIGGFK